MSTERQVTRAASLLACGGLCGSLLMREARVAGTVGMVVFAVILVCALMAHFTEEDE